jgi:hypothetical protein
MAYNFHTRAAVAWLLDDGAVVECGGAVIACSRRARFLIGPIGEADDDEVRQAELICWRAYPPEEALQGGGVNVYIHATM